MVDATKNALRTLSEKYLAKTILEDDILKYFKEILPPTTSIDSRKITQLFSDRTGKSRNTIYKSKNEFVNYSAVSLLRYWSVLRSLCIENNVPLEDIPRLDHLLDKYDAVIEWLNQITVEDDLATLVIQHPDVAIRLFQTFKDSLNSDAKRPLTSSEKQVLKEIMQHSVIQQQLSTEKDSRIERMKQK